ncbi:MAG: hypothetical protein ACMXX8_00845 [Candidatus Woesearchaeota archaeon]
MNKLNKKSQTATEYMVVLAVVIIISLIVAAILGQFPGLGGSARLRGSSAFWHSSDIGVTHFSITYDGTQDDVVITIRNNHNYFIRVTDLFLKQSDDFTPAQDGDEGHIQGLFVLAPGDIATITKEGLGNFCSRPNEPYSLKLLVKYKDDVTGETYTFSSGANYLEGRCAG